MNMEPPEFATRPSTSPSEMPQPRRASTAPVSHPPPQRSNSMSSASSASSRFDDVVETLYNHPSVKIIAFTSSQRSPLSSFPPTAEDVPPGTLPASSRLERTIAVGPFRIYRAPGSVAFLSCGSALQPILPKSQCWCIDEANSRFVLQIRRPQYWRIEVPIRESDDAQRALLLRDVFDRILLFEKTECPFQRSFTVQLPAPPQTPVKKKAWTPAGKNLISSPLLSNSFASSPPSASRTTSKERRATISTAEIKAVEAAEDGQKPGELRQTEKKPGWGSSVESKVPSANESEGGEPWLQDTEEAKETVAVIPKMTPDIRNGPDTSKIAPEVANDRVNDVSSLAPEDSNLAGKPGKVQMSRDSSRSNLIARHLEEPENKKTQPARTGVADKHVVPTPSVPDVKVPKLVTQEARKANQAEAKAEVKARTRAKETQVPDRQPRSHAPAELEKAESLEVPNAAEGFHSEAAEFHDQEVRPQRTTKPALSKEEVLGDDSGDEEPSTFEGSGYVAPVNLTRKRMTRVLAGRAFTAPPQLTLVTSPPSKSKDPASRKPSPPELPEPPQAPPSDESSPVGSTDSFHSVQSWHSPITPLPPSPPTSRPVTPSVAQFPHPHENVVISQPYAGDLSDHTMTPNTAVTLRPSTAGATDHSGDADSPMPRSPADMDDLPMSPAPVEGRLRPFRSSASLRSSALQERMQLRHRPRQNNFSISRRALSPLPSPANLFSPVRHNQPSRLDTVRRLPGAIVQKTVEILMSPPSHLVNLMLKVAAKIAAGEWRGLVFGLGEGGEQIPVHWDYSDGEFSSWGDEDDFTMSSLRQSSSASLSQTNDGSARNSSDFEDSRSWEVD